MIRGGNILGYILYKNKIYKSRALRGNRTGEAVIDDGGCLKSVPREECRIFRDANKFPRRFIRSYHQGDRAG